MMCELNEGSMWRKMIRGCRAPQSRAASTKSSSRSERKRPRTTRARPVQPISERISVIAK